MSGREAYTNEWVDGNANKDNLATVKNTPIWFFHSKEDKVSPVKGSRINYQILKKQLNAQNVKYTEFSFIQAVIMALWIIMHTTLRMQFITARK